MQVEEREHLLQIDKFARQLFIVFRQRGGKFIERGRQHPKQRRHAYQHHDHHNGDGQGATHPSAQKPGDEGVKDDSEKECQQQLHENIRGGVDTGKDHHQTGHFKQNMEACFIRLRKTRFIGWRD